MMKSDDRTPVRSTRKKQVRRKLPGTSSKSRGCALISGGSLESTGDATDSGELLKDNDDSPLNDICHTPDQKQSFVRSCKKDFSPPLFELPKVTWGKSFSPSNNKVSSTPKEVQVKSELTLPSPVDNERPRTPLLSRIWKESRQKPDEQPVNAEETTPNAPVLDNLYGLIDGLDDDKKPEVLSLFRSGLSTSPLSQGREVKQCDVLTRVQVTPISSNIKSEPLLSPIVAQQQSQRLLEQTFDSIADFTSDFTMSEDESVNKPGMTTPSPLTKVKSNNYKQLKRLPGTPEPVQGKRAKLGSPGTPWRKYKSEEMNSSYTICPDNNSPSCADIDQVIEEKRRAAQAKLKATHTEHKSNRSFTKHKSFDSSLLSSPEPDCAQIIEQKRLAALERLRSKHAVKLSSTVSPSEPRVQNQQPTQQVHDIIEQKRLAALERRKQKKSESKSPPDNCTMNRATLTVLSSVQHINAAPSNSTVVSLATTAVATSHTVSVCNPSALATQINSSIPRAVPQSHSVTAGQMCVLKESGNVQMVNESVSSTGERKMTEASILAAFDTILSSQGADSQQCSIVFTDDDMISSSVEPHVPEEINPKSHPLTEPNIIEQKRKAALEKLKHNKHADDEASHEDQKVSITAVALGNPDSTTVSSVDLIEQKRLAALEKLKHRKQGLSIPESSGAVRCRPPMSMRFTALKEHTTGSDHDQQEVAQSIIEQKKPISDSMGKGTCGTGTTPNDKNPAVTTDAASEVTADAADEVSPAPAMKKVCISSELIAKTLAASDAIEQKRIEALNKLKQRKQAEAAAMDADSGTKQSEGVSSPTISMRFTKNKPVTVEGHAAQIKNLEASLHEHKQHIHKVLAARQSPTKKIPTKAASPSTPWRRYKSLNSISSNQSQETDSLPAGSTNHSQDGSRHQTVPSNSNINSASSSNDVIEQKRLAAMAKLREKQNNPGGTFARHGSFGNSVRKNISPPEQSTSLSIDEIIAAKRKAALEKLQSKQTPFGAKEQVITSTLQPTSAEQHRIDNSKLLHTKPSIDVKKFIFKPASSSTSKCNETAQPVLTEGNEVKQSSDAELSTSAKDLITRKREAALAKLNKCKQK